MIVYGKRYTGLNVEGHQDRVIGEIFSWQKGPEVRKEKHVPAYKHLRMACRQGYGENMQDK